MALNSYVAEPLTTRLIYLTFLLTWDKLNSIDRQKVKQKLQKTADEASQEVKESI